MRTRDESKELLVRQKSLELIVNQGFEGFSMQKLAKAAAVSPATLYIYYKDKEDLITQIGIDIGKKFSTTILQNFDPTLPFAEGLRIQWQNRAKYALENRLETEFYQQIRSSSFRDKVMGSFMDDFKAAMGQFVHNSVQRGELSPMPIEVFWSVAYAPLYNLIQFHNEGHSLAGKRFEFSEETMNQTFELVLKALKP